MNEPIFHCGQTVVWPAAPLGFAQVAELRRSCVRLFYRTRRGGVRQPVVPASRLAELQGSSNAPPLPLSNPFFRGLRAADASRSKAFRSSQEVAPCK